MTDKSNKAFHLSVMAEECVEFFSGISLTTFYEGTLGAGGHARAILEAHPEIKRYIACDRDPQAIEIAKAYLKPWQDKIEFIQGDFADLDRHLMERKINSVDGFFLI